MTGRVARAVVRHRRVVMVAWLIILLGSLAVVARVPGRLSQQFVQPGTSSYDANAAILRAYGSGGSSAPLVAGIEGPQTAATSFSALRQVPGVRVEPVPRFDSNRLRLALVFTPPASGQGVPARLLGEIRSALDRSTPAGDTPLLTGLPLLQQGSSGSPGGQVLVESIIGGSGALVVLALVFGSFLALLPLAVAILSVLTSFLLLYGLSFLTTVNFVALFLIGLIGLGVAIDYSLLIVTRWREELDAGRPNLEAVLVATERAGRSVAFSGLTVAISLAALVFLPVPFLRSLGYAGLFIPLVSIAVALTVLPVLLLNVGPRLDGRRVKRRAAGRAAGGADGALGATPDQSRGWWRWAHTVVRPPGIARGVSLPVLVPISLATLGIRLGDSSAASLAKKGPAANGLGVLTLAGVPSGLLTPIEVLTPLSEQRALTSALDAIGGEAAVVAAPLPTAAGAGAGASVPSPSVTVLDVIPVQQTTLSSGTAVVKEVRAVATRFPGVQVGGPGASEVDFIDAVYGHFPFVIGMIGVLTFLLLAWALRSLLLPLKALVLNALSVTAAYGVMVLVWQDGHGSSLIAGLPATGAITDWVPLMVFAFLFGLSMDYEVFLLSRMRESYDATGDTNTGVVEGLARTGRLVTGAALILFLSFVSMGSDPATFLKVFATGLAAGILLDAVVIRSLLAPALVSLFGRANWWLPGPIARTLAARAKPE
jgi:RND superfamily putative drug exporter